MRILVIEDEELLAESIAEALRHETYAVDLAPDGRSALELMAVNTYDLVVLDWTIPAPSGIELLRIWRSEGIATPVLMLTGKTDVEDRVAGLDGGADDYLTKPFSLVEFLARTRSLLRRPAKTLASAVLVDDLEIDRPARDVRVAGTKIDLPAKEFAILEYLASRLDEVVTRTELTDHVWDDSFDSLSNPVDVTIYRLRKKIDGDRDQKLLHTVRGVGYVLKSKRS